VPDASSTVGGSAASPGRALPAVRTCAVFVVATALTLSSGCTSGNTAPTFTPAAHATRNRPEVSPDTLPPLSKFVTNPDGSQVTTVSADYLFDLGSDVVVGSALAALEGILPQIRAHDGTVVVTGYTDGLGSTDANLDLSKRRAGAIKRWLLEQGIADDAVKAVGKGEEGATEGVADAHRRRVEIALQ
jgi:outer membrane protein OmpA-like peptidoglycan-associated protein